MALCKKQLLAGGVACVCHTNGVHESRVSARPAIQSRSPLLRIRETAWTHYAFSGSRDCVSILRMRNLITQSRDRVEYGAFSRVRTYAILNLQE